MQEIDPRFKAAKERAAARARRRSPLALAAGGVVGLGLIGGAAWAVLSGFVHFGAPPSPADDTEPAVAYTSPFIDVPGDPLVLAQQSGSTAQSTLVAPPELVSVRTGGDVKMISDVMISSDAALNTTMPASREEFAFFQGQSAGDAGSEAGPAGGDSRAQAASTSIPLIPEKFRYKPWHDLVVQVSDSRSLNAVLTQNGIDPDRAGVFEGVIAKDGDLASTVTKGALVAVRYEQNGVSRIPLQISLYGPKGYVGSAAVDDKRDAVDQAADAWIDDDLTAHKVAPVNVDATAKYRLIDAIYSTALRNGMPGTLLGEAMVAFSKAFDTDAFAQPGDRLTLLYSPVAMPGAEGLGQVLYAGIQRQSGGQLRCYVDRTTSEPRFRCWGAGAVSAGPRLAQGLVVPVSGVMRSGFGPRTNPETGKPEIHPGVDWAAPMGSAVRAAMAGTVEALDDDPRYGKTVTLSHDGGESTYYAHLDRRASLSPGMLVTAGQVIGYVGTSGETKVPHLHFEFRKNGVATDPYIHDAGGLDAAAVTAMVDQIIKVESGSTPENAEAQCAANPTSTAVGPGQFIKSTWLRMMKSYRADLYDSMDATQLLKLRCDYTLSYEMVTNLAKEGEAYLTARGLKVTAGRLYLAHFLGAKSAANVLQANPDANLADVVSQGVFNANAFLVNRGIDTPAEIEKWADRKMSGHRGHGGPPPLPQEVAVYKGIVDTLLAGG